MSSKPAPGKPVISASGADEADLVKIAVDEKVPPEIAKEPDSRSISNGCGGISAAADGMVSTVCSEKTVS